MRMTSIAAGAVLALAFAPLANAETPADPTGVWINDTGRGAIEIKPCGKGLCGHVVWVKEGTDAKGCGKQIIGDAMSVGGGRWDNGWIYSPEKRKNYDVELKPLNDGNLRVVGYAGVKFLSKTMIWTRAPADLKRCDAIEAKAAPAAPAETEAAPVEAKAPEAAPAAPVADPKPPTAEGAPPTNAADASTTAAEPAPETAPTKEAEAATPAPEAETAGNSEGGEEPGQRSEKKKLSIGGIDLDSVLTKTKSGKCKLDLPWVKVEFGCEKD